MQPYSHIALVTAKTWKQSKQTIQTSTDEQDVAHVYYGIPLKHKKDETMPSAATWMDLEISY